MIDIIENPQSAALEQSRKTLCGTTIITGERYSHVPENRELFCGTIGSTDDARISTKLLAAGDSRGFEKRDRIYATALASFERSGASTSGTCTTVGSSQPNAR